MTRVAFVITIIAALFGESNALAEEVPWLKDVQKPPEELPANTPKLGQLAKGKATLAQWQTTRSELRDLWMEFLGPLASVERTLPSLRVIKETRSHGVVRQLVEYDCTQGEKTHGYLLKPAVLKGKTAGLVVFHSTIDHSIHQPAGVKGAPEKAFGWKLAKRGYVVFCPRNFLWPVDDRIEASAQTAAMQKKYPESKGMAKMLFDAQLAVDILVNQAEVDPDRIGAVGHSLGAKEVLYLAAFDERVKVSVSSEGGIGTQFSNWNAPWYLGAEIRNGKFTREHHEVLGLVPPRAFLLIGGESADGDRSWPFIEAVLPVYSVYDRPARIGLLNHRRGHAVPPLAEERIYEWVETYLPLSP